MPPKSKTLVFILLATLALTQYPPTVRAQAPTPIISAATILGDFARDYQEACDKYTIASLILEGKVQKISLHKRPSGKNGATVYVVPQQPGDRSMIPIALLLGEVFSDQLDTLKEGDIIQSDVSFFATPAPPILHEITGFTANNFKILGADKRLPQLREQLVSWIRKNNAIKPAADGSDNRLVLDQTKKIDASLAAGDDFTITFGAGLMLSKKATVLSVQDGKMLLTEFTPAQNAILKLPETSASHATIGSAALRMDPETQITTPTFEGAGNWDLAKPLIGKVDIKVTVKKIFPEGDYGLRLVTYSGNQRTSFFSSFHTTNLGNFTSPLRFAALNFEIEPMKLTDQPIPHIVYFELVRRIGPDRFDPAKKEPLYEIISEPIALILNLSNSKAPKSPAAP